MNFKALIISTALGLAMTGAAVAQSSSSNSQSGSASNSASSSSTRSVAVSGGGQGGSVIIGSQPANTTSTQNLRSNGTVTYDGDYTVRNVPQVTAPSMGSGHPCGLGNSLGISIVGGGATGGSTRSDDACLLAQMGHTDAATIMIAARNKSACRALVASGKISSSSYCGSGTSARVSNNAPSAVAPTTTPNAATARLSTSGAQPRSIPANSVTCGSPIRIKSWAADRVDSATAIAFCRQ